MNQNVKHTPELSVLNPYPTIIRGPDLLHDLVQTSSEAIAIDFLENGAKRRRISYRTLHAMSDTLALKITELLAGLKNASTIIPVLLSQGPELYVVLLAILKAGKAFCPLNHDIPEERLKFVLEDISADILITDTYHVEKVYTTTGISTLLVDRELPERNGYHSLKLPQTATTDLAYVLYTSGSTGLPKAVCVSHRAVTQSLLAHDRHLPEFSRFLQFAAPTFDVSIFEIFFPWYRGRTLVSCTRAQMLDDLPRMIQMLEVDAAELTPTVASNLLQGRASVPGLKLLLTIGEMLTKQVVDEFGGNTLQESILWGMYGPTEAAIHCTLQTKFSTSSSIGMIGIPLDTVSAFVVDPVNRADGSGGIEILPTGEIGELVVGGPQIAEGYLNRPELTTTSFIDHPKYGYLYRTGDRARLYQDGTLECLGRIVTGQVKIRGQRVELGEIEQIITKADGCRAATVMVIEDNLVAFCATGSRNLSRAGILQLCQQWLPDFMVPSDVHFVSSMPQLPSGKVDRAFLESLYLRTFQISNPSTIVSNNNADIAILHVLQHHLKHAVSSSSNLAAAGLNSLQSIRIASELRRNGYNISGMDVLSAHTAKDLTQACRDTNLQNCRDQTQAWPTGPVLEAHADLGDLQKDIAHVLPCTPLQEAMLTETTLRPNAYCNWIEVELSVSRTFQEIRTMLTALADANETLRTGFSASSTNTGNFIQIVWKSLSLSQTQEVAHFSRAYSLGSEVSLLRPLTIQIKSGQQKPRLLFQIYHALYDGWSFDLLLYDLDRLLLGLGAQQRPQFQQMVRYCTRDQRDTHASDKEYWAEVLDGYIPSSLPNYNGTMVKSSGIQSLSSRSVINPGILFEHARKLMVNPQIFFQVATAYVLGLYTGKPDVVLGNVTSGRTVPVTGIEEMVGPCIALLPFRLRLDPSSSVRDVLIEAHALNRAGMHHCTLPLRHIAKVAHIRPGTRLFDVLFVWQQSFNSSPNSNLNARIVDSADDLEFKITLEFEPCKDNISFRATFDPATIPEKQVRYLSQQIDDVVHIFLNDSDCKVADIARYFTGSSRSIANPSPCHEDIQHGPSYSVEKWALETPHKQAVIFGHLVNHVMEVKETITYATLNSRANQLARLLLERGVDKDQLVCVIMEKSIDLYVSILAVLKIGSGYLPLTSDTPIERIETILADAKITVCIGDAESSKLLYSYISGSIIDLDAFKLSEYPESNLDTPYYGSHLAYAIFTSGSTGTPKGVLITQDNLMSNIGYLSTIYPFSATSRLLQSCSQAFDVSVFEIFFSWHTGICLCTATKNDMFHDLESSINRLGITHLSLTPTVASLVNPKKVSQVKFLVTAGEALTEHVRRKWAGHGLFQGYGPSETTNICTVRPSVTPMDLINNIGPAFPNTSAFVLDPDSKVILPRGAVGELCFGGMQVFRGYLNRPELNATKIINLPGYGRVYRSGDMGVLLPDDCLLSTGRLDDQVKIRGQRVELGEITTTVLDSTFVRDCTAVLLSSNRGSISLAVFWVPKTAFGDQFSPLRPKSFRSEILEIFDSILHRLPIYMIPSHVVPISRLPMTAQAKIDKRLLQTTFEALSEEDLQFVAQSYNTNDGAGEFSEWEKNVAEHLARTLGLSFNDIKRNSSFFSLGLDSVSAIHFSKNLRDSNLGHFTVPLILQNPTIAHLASSEAIRPSFGQPRNTHTTTLANVFGPAQVRRIHSQYEERGLHVAKILPCTPLQEAMLSSEQLPSESAYYNTMIFDVKGDVSHLQDCWALMVQRHEILRTSFVQTDDAQHAFAQVVLKEDELQWNQFDPERELLSQIQKTLSDLLSTFRPPVWLAIDKTETSTKLLFCCHHALYDGTAVSVLLEEIQMAYSSHNLPPPVSYDLYLEHMLSQDLEGADEFWKISLADLETTMFPSLTNIVVDSQAVSGSVTQQLKLSLSEARKYCQTASLSLLSVVQAAWVKLLHLYTGASDLCFGNVLSGRTLSGHDLERLVAPCFNTLPVRVDHDFRDNNLALARKIHAFNIESLAFQLTPLRRIQGATLKDGGRLFDTLVIFQQPTNPLDDSIWTLEQDTGFMDLPVVCEILQDQIADTLTLILHYRSTVLSEIDATIVAETFNNAFTNVIRFPQASANDTLSFPAKFRAESNMSFEHLDVDGPLLHSGLEKIASLQPDTIALDFLYADGERTTWSYKTLNEKANELAHFLLTEGVLPEDIVPIHMQKSPQFYASILGVLKAGAAFAPIHPDLPEKRKELMLTELDPKIVLYADTIPSIGDFSLAKMVDVEVLERFPVANPVIQSFRDTNLAYCLYTSGSTGLPKAVSMEHRAPVQTIEASRTLTPWTMKSRLLQYAATTFDMCYYDCFVAWTFGITLCAAEQHFMLDELARVINMLDVDLLDLTPSVAASLTRTGVPKVKWLYCIGEAFSRSIANEWAGACVNSYGPTEAAFCTTIHPVTKHTKASIIGRPFPTTSFAVFSPEGDRPLPLLSTGELYIGGAQLARGYFDQPDLTEAKFTFKCGQRFYKSGDMVRMLSDGNFEFLGRADDQVKIRGLRVELGEINQVLQDSHSDIATVTTLIVKKSKDAKEQLVTFLVATRPIDDNQGADIKQKVKKAAIDRLPSYMVPQFYLFVEHLPRSMAGKIDKKALTVIFDESMSETLLPVEIGAHPSDHAWTERETIIRSIFAQLSNTNPDNIRPTTTIYQLGLDSISAVQIAAALRRQGFQATSAAVMKYLNCIDLATYLNQDVTLDLPASVQFDFVEFEQRYKSQVLGECGINDEDVEAILPCTPLQNGMVSQFLAKEGLVYLNHIRTRLLPEIRVDQLRKAWKAIMDRHDMLRTGFVHVKEKHHPFAMVRYKPEAVGLPWESPSDDTSFQSFDVWLRRLQRGGLNKLHQPLWRIRTICKDGETYMDLAIFHALFDAQSLQLILHDVELSYRGKILGEITPTKIALSAILRLSKDEQNQSREFWTGLRNTTSPCRFPSMTPLKYLPSTAVVLTKRSTRLLSSLENGCRKANISLQAAGSASWLTLLSAYTGQPTVTCGVVLAGRSFETGAEAAFPCINTVPLTCTISENRAVTLERIMDMNTIIQQHQYTPLNQIQRYVGYPNEPLFDSIFAYQKSTNVEKGSNTDFWNVVNESASTEYTLSIELEPKQSHLEYRLTFLPHIIPTEQANLILDQLDHLMEGLIFQEECPVYQNSLNTLLYSITPAKERSLPSEATLLHELVEITATKYPDRIAFDFAHEIQDKGYSSRKWTYRELDIEGNRIAHVLISQGALPGDLVGVCFEKCPEASFAMLGILKAGCAFVAIDPGAPAARQAFIIKDSNARIVLSMMAQSARWREATNISLLNLDEIETLSSPQTKPVLQRELDPQDRSYCLYTSGTTGMPKGCELTHENAVQALLAFQRLFAGHWAVDSRWLQFASFHFDVSVLEQYWSWSVGICVVSAPRDLIFENLAHSINTLGITHIDLTPTLAQILHPDDVPSLCKGVFITGGESLKQEILDVWGPKGVIHNGYGPTEATIGCTMYPRVPANGKPSNIGPQFDNVGSFVLQPDSDVPVLRGGVGELCVSGKLVGKGYLNRPDLTKERFPLLKNLGERVYRTGDFVRILHDGSFDFLGRADDQIKLRGQRLEIGEINSVIRRSNGDISDVATLVLKHPKQQKEQLVTFIVVGVISKNDSHILPDESDVISRAKEICHEQLPLYMVPTHFITLKFLPLNTNNKTDGKKLERIYQAMSANDLQKLSASGRGRGDPWSKQEQRLRSLLKDVLNVSDDDIDRDSSFFELGMDSISVIGVSRAMKSAGFSDATASLIMQNPTIHRIAKVLQLAKATRKSDGSLVAAQQIINAAQHRHRRTVAHAISIDPSDIEALAPCTPLQQGMIARYLESSDGIYYNTFVFELTNIVDESKLRAAWESVHTSTQILRTVFVNTEDGYVQAVIQPAPLHWKMEVAIKNESIGACLSRLRRTWLRDNRTELGRPFEIVSVAFPDRRVLAVHLFHGLYDGSSIQFLFESVWNEYNGRKMNSDAPSFQSALTYGPLRVVEGAKAFWQDHFSDSDFKPFPTLIETPDDEPATVTRVLDHLTTLESTRRKMNVTAQAIAQACWISVLNGYLKGNVILGLVVSGRSLDFEGAEHVVGPLFNTIPYKHNPQCNSSWASMIKKLHEFNIAAHPYQHTPLRDITKWCRRSLSQPLFDTLFVYQIAQSNDECTNNNVWKLLDGDVVADYPLSFEIEQRGTDEFKLTLVTQGHISNQKTSTELLDRFERALLQVLEDSTVTVNVFPEMNGIVENGSIEQTHVSNGNNGTTDFEWTDDALKIRSAIATLTNTDLDEVNESTTIFELGLDSIDAIKLSSRLRKHGMDLPVSGIMRGLTIANMVANMSSSKRQNDRTLPNTRLDSCKYELETYLKRRDIDMEGIDQILPLTPLQEAMTAEMVASEFTSYYNYNVMKLSQAVNLSRLRDSWEQVVDASPILRTSFVEVDDVSLDYSLAQVIRHERHEFWTDASTNDEPDFPSIFEEFRRDALKSSLSIPLFNIRLIQTPNHSYLMLVISHALYDGWSLSLLHTDIHRAYYDQFTPRLGYEPTLAKILSTPDDDATSFWRDYLADAKSSLFPRRPDTSKIDEGEVHRQEHFSRVALSNIQAFARQNNISLQTLGQTVFGMVLSFYVGSLDITFGCVLSGRDDDEQSQVLFPTMNTVAIRTILHGSSTEMLHYSQDNFNNIKQWQHYPLRKALSAAGIHGRLFEGLFIYQKTVGEHTEENEMLYRSIEGHSNVEYPVCVEMEVVRDKLMWRCAISDEVFSEAGTEEILSRLDEVLTQIMKQPEQPVIGATSHGISVCGLPSFETGVSKTSNGTSSEDAEDLDERVMSKTARKIIEVLAAVSRTPEDEIRADTTIFHVGLDSISAIKLSSLLRKQDVALSVGDMLRAGTVEKMARLVDARSAAPANKDQAADSNAKWALYDLDRTQVLSLAGLQETDVEEIFPLTGGQLYMLSMWLNCEGTNFCPTFRYDLRGSMPFKILQRSWKALVAANTIMRTRFVCTKDRRVPYVQMVLRETYTFVTNATDLSEEDIYTSIKHHASDQPWAHLLVSQTSTGWDLRLHIHHALYDGVSLPLLMQQFQDICNGTKALPQINALGSLVANYFTAQEIENRTLFWTKYLVGVKQHRLSQPSSLPMARTEIFTPALVQTRILDMFARTHGISMQALFLAVYAKLYAAFTGTCKGEDVVIGAYLANRSLPIENLVSAAVPTVNLLPLRISLAAETGIIDIATQIQCNLREIGDPKNSLASLWEIATWTGVKVDTFVNFLTLPDAAQEDAMSLRDDEVKIGHVREWEQAVSRVTTLASGDLKDSNQLRNDEVNGVYLHAVDVEASIRNGALNVGVFAPVEMMSLEGGKRLLQNIKDELEALGEDMP